MKKKPTKKQAAMLKFIEEYTEAHNSSPSYREIMRGLNLNSVSSVAEHIENCITAGFLQKNPHEARSLRVIPQEDYAETLKLFENKLSALNAEIDVIDAEMSDGGDLEQLSRKRQKTLEKIETLNKAIKILDIL